MKNRLRAKGVFLGISAHVGLRVFLAVATVLFTLFLVVYVERMTFPDWRPLCRTVGVVAEYGLLILVISSAGFHWASVNAERGDLEGVKTGLLTAGVASFAFLAGQLWAWQQSGRFGLLHYARTRPIGFFYLLTALHGVHLFGGLVAWGRTSAKVKAEADMASNCE